jgi:hypothetical protein
MAFVGPVYTARCGNVPPHARVSSRRGVGVGKWPMESGKEVIPQSGVWNAKLKRGEQELDGVVLQVAQCGEEDLSCRGCLRGVKYAL